MESGGTTALWPSGKSLDDSLYLFFVLSSTFVFISKQAVLSIFIFCLVRLALTLSR